MTSWLESESPSEFKFELILWADRVETSVDITYVPFLETRKTFVPYCGSTHALLSKELNCTGTQLFAQPIITICRSNTDSEAIWGLHLTYCRLVSKSPLHYVTMHSDREYVAAHPRSRHIYGETENCLRIPQRQPMQTSARN